MPGEICLGLLADLPSSFELLVFELLADLFGTHAKLSGLRSIPGYAWSCNEEPSPPRTGLYSTQCGLAAVRAPDLRPSERGQGASAEGADSSRFLWSQVSSYRRLGGCHAPKAA
jgi:hypothetical protein